MDFGLINKSCENCKGIYNCNKYCSLHAGHALYRYINAVDTVETRIGEYSSRERGGKSDLIISGHQIFELGSPSWILTNMGTVLDASGKFKPVFDKSPVQILREYCKHINMGSDEETEAINKLKLMNTNKLLVLPFKPHSKCKYKADSKDSKLDKSAELIFIKWLTNKDTYKLECFVGLKPEQIMNPLTVKIPVTKYLQDFKLSALDLQFKVSEQNSSLIEMTDHGMIRPIAVRDKDSLVILDGTYLYSYRPNITNIIGRWDEKGKLETYTTIKSKAYKKIKDNIEFIKSHRKYIAPYMLYDIHEYKL